MRQAKHKAFFSSKLLASVVLIWFVTGCLVHPEQTSSKTVPKASKKYTLFAGGDTMIARWVHYTAYEKGAAWILEDVRELVGGADIAMTNLECVVSTRGKFFDKGEGRPYLYRARPEMLDILTEAGFDLVVTANNHTMDYGPEALLEEMELLDAVGIAHVGAGLNLKEAATPTYIRVGEVVVAFISIETYFPNCAATADRAGTFHARGTKAILKALEGPIALARRSADLVVFTPHWGKNWTENPPAERIKLAHKIIELGVDAILGHSAHQIHGVEVYKGRPIVYDMGSFLFDTIRQGRLRFSAGFVLEFSREGFSRLSIHPLHLRSSHTVRARGRNLEYIQNLVTKLTRELDPELKLVREGNVITLDFEPQPRLQPRPTIHTPVLETARTVALPEKFRKKKTNVVFEEPPVWTRGFDPVKLKYGVEVIGAQTAEAVRPGRAFTSDVALAVSGPLDGRWIASIKGVERSGDEQFTWEHPFADGGWLPNLWEKDQIVVDQTLVRPPRMPEGTYDLYWRLENRTDKSVLHVLESENSGTDGYVHIGQIIVTKRNIPDGPAGLSWDGHLPNKPREEE
jgi:poly-gamma-glutamate capsule biosynthesis protein CapA/YwtB (metallophosphatase superfamily)